MGGGAYDATIFAFEFSPNSGEWVEASRRTFLNYTRYIFCWCRATKQPHDGRCTSRKKKPYKLNIDCKEIRKSHGRVAPSV